MKLRLLAATLVALTLTGGTALAQDKSVTEDQILKALAPAPKALAVRTTVPMLASCAKFSMATWKS